MLANQQVISLATADKNGVPNVCPMDFMKVRDDETLIVANFFWKRIEANLKVALNIYAPPMKACKIKGNVELISEDPLLDEVVE